MNDAYVDLDTRIQAFRDSDAQREDLLAVSSSSKKAAHMIQMRPVLP